MRFPWVIRTRAQGRSLSPFRRGVPACFQFASRRLSQLSRGLHKTEKADSLEHSESAAHLFSNRPVDHLRVRWSGDRSNCSESEGQRDAERRDKSRIDMDVWERTLDVRHDPAERCHIDCGHRTRLQYESAFVRQTIARYRQAFSLVQPELRTAFDRVEKIE